MKFEKKETPVFSEICLFYKIKINELLRKNDNLKRKIEKNKSDDYEFEESEDVIEFFEFFYFS